MADQVNIYALNYGGILEMNALIYGWFDAADQSTPTFDPSHSAPCLYCGEPITSDDVRTISMMGADRAERSYFYRVHRTCANKHGSTKAQEIDDVVWDMIRHHERLLPEPPVSKERT